MNYVVQPGDTIHSIAARFYIAVQAIIAANRITDPRAIMPGTTLYIPIPRPSGQAPTLPPLLPDTDHSDLLKRIERLEAEVDRLNGEVYQLEQRVRGVEAR